MFRQGPDLTLAEICRKHVWPMIGDLDKTFDTFVLSYDPAYSLLTKRAVFASSQNSDMLSK